MDYISVLNMEELPVFTSDDNTLTAFTDSSFFDFDQFNTGNLKLDYQQQFQQTIQQLESIIPTQEQSLPSVSKPVKELTPITEETEERDSLITISSDQDKKKRNTAASARFRIKKKQKEQEMERNLKELTERVNNHNRRIQQLEMENACLKSLLVQKSEQKSNDLLKSIKEKSLENWASYNSFFRN